MSRYSLWTTALTCWTMNLPVLQQHLPDIYASIMPPGINGPADIPAFPLMFIKYPDKIETVNLRVAPRIKIDLPARFLDAAGVRIAEAALTDISEGGCGLRVPILQGKELSPEAGYSITFTVMDKEVSVGCAIKRLEKGGEAYLLGMQFTNVSEKHKGTLSLLVDFLKKHTAV